MIELDLLDAAAGQLTGASVAADILGLDVGRINPVTGPIRVVGARSGDALVVHVVDLDVDTWGWSALIPGFGLLADDFPDPELVHCHTADGWVDLPFGPRIPARPMIGTLGVALPEPGRHPLLPPSRFGGNMDIRHLTRGATVTLPVGVDGALLSAGDTHAAMGDGEVCGTGVETRGRAVLRIDLVEGAAPLTPVLETSADSQRSGAALVTTGIGPDLMTGARDAARAMVDLVVRRTGLAPAHAYVLASLTADLIISEIVDAPNWVVSLHLPSSVLEKS
jgi:formamidase